MVGAGPNWDGACFDLPTVPFALNIGATYYQNLWGVNYGLLQNGTNYISVQVKDRAGNTTASTDAFYILKDAVGPLVTDNQTGDDTWRNSNTGTYDVDFQGNPSNVGQIQVKVTTGTNQTGSPQEYHDAAAEGVRFHFLRAPRGLSGTEGLLCSVMAMGAPDGSGRAAPADTGVTEAIPADTVITAVGAGVDPATLSALGLSACAARADTQETELPGVFLVGDAASGPATIVQAIASARRAVQAICAREGGSAAPRWEIPAPDADVLRSVRDRTIDPSVPGARDAARVEASRCLGCSTLCLKCVEVCPNRANTIVRIAKPTRDASFRDVVQIVHQDALCNECGTCATFCPWNGKPFRDKLTVFPGEKEFTESTSPGFFLRAGRGLLRTGTRVTALPAEPGDGADARALAVVQAIQEDNPWLIGGAP